VESGRLRNLLVAGLQGIFLKKVTAIGYFIVLAATASTTASGSCLGGHGRFAGRTSVTCGDLDRAPAALVAGH
jgi:hypothetical protein